MWFRRRWVVLHTLMWRTIHARPQATGLRSLSLIGVTPPALASVVALWPDAHKPDGSPGLVVPERLIRIRRETGTFNISTTSVDYSRYYTTMPTHHNMPEIVIHRDTDDDWKRISLVDDYGDKISLSVEQLRGLAAAVLSDEFPLITGL